MNKKINNLLKTIAMILLVVGLGVFAVNQTMTYYYRAEFLKQPCNICLELNEHLEQCFVDASNVRVDMSTGEPKEPNAFNLSEYATYKE